MRENLLGLPGWAGSVLLLIHGGIADARPPQVLQQVATSTDTAITRSGQFIEDHQVLSEDPGGTLTAEVLGVPAGVELTGYSPTPFLDVFSVATTVQMPGGLVVEPRDVAGFDGGSYLPVFDGSAQGVPDGVRVDAVSIIGVDLALSFDITVDLGAFTAAPEDLVRFDGVGFTMLFDGSARGIPDGLNIDAASWADLEGESTFFLSFDTAGQLGGVRFEDEDVLQWVLSSDEITLVYDGSLRDPAWPAADLDALYVLALTDTDEDGLADQDEPLFGSDPEVADSDGDGLSDGEEVWSTGTDPTDPDTDDDLVGDAEDCAPLDGAVSSTPDEVQSLTFEDATPTSLVWQALAAPVSYDVLRGDLATLALDAGIDSGSCEATVGVSNWVDPDPDPLPGQGFYYLPRGRNICGSGPFGTASAGVPRGVPASGCP